MLLLLFACATKPADDAPIERAAPTGWGPYATGVDTFWFIDDRGKEITLDVWYPALDQGEALHQYEPFELTVTGLDEPAPNEIGAPYPLVAFSHGLGGIRFQSPNLTEFLASHGFVVVAPDHNFNTLLDLDDSMLGIVALERPGDLSRAVDYVMAHERLGALVDPEAPIGIAGHSFGAVTALNFGGAEVDVEHALAFCEDNDGDGCDYFKDDLSLEGANISGPDDRVAAIASLSPGAWFVFGEDGENLANTAPALLMGGTSDTVLGYESEAVPTWERVATPKRLVTLERAGHWGFSDICLLLPVFGDCEGEAAGYMDPARAMELAQFAVTNHLGWELTGDPAYDPSSWDGWSGEDFGWESVEE